MIDLKKLSEEDVLQLTSYFLENRIIKFRDILQPIEEYFWKFDFNAITQSYELYLGVPKDWVHDMSLSGYTISLVNENDNGKIIKLHSISEENIADLDELILFAIDITQRNTAILAKIREKESELQQMKKMMVDKQLELDREIEILKTVKVELVVEPIVEPIVEKTIVSKEDTEKFVELITNGKKR
jgi:hypothetical protein